MKNINFIFGALLMLCLSSTAFSQLPGEPPLDPIEEPPKAATPPKKPKPQGASLADCTRKNAECDANLANSERKVQAVSKLVETKLGELKSAQDTTRLDDAYRRYKEELKERELVTRELGKCVSANHDSYANCADQVNRALKESRELAEVAISISEHVKAQSETAGRVDAYTQVQSALNEGRVVKAKSKWSERQPTSK
jgi:hypothetical protein